MLQKEAVLTPLKIIYYHMVHFFYLVNRSSDIIRLNEKLNEKKKWEAHSNHVQIDLNKFISFNIHCLKNIARLGPNLTKCIKMPHNFIFINQ